MISKELLSKVLEKEILSIEIKDNLATWVAIDSAGAINIYELAHKCKTWAFNLDTTMINSSVTEALMGIASIRDNNVAILFCEIADTEPEAIFKACNYILKELSNK